jgi:hypothetical protein
MSETFNISFPLSLYPGAHIHYNVIARHSTLCATLHFLLLLDHLLFHGHAKKGSLNHLAHYHYHYAQRATLHIYCALHYMHITLLM